jgi:ABC-type polysaccharide/polyol phosphate export permease
MASPTVRLAIQDIVRSLRDIGLAAFLAWEDIRQRYVRTMLGPLWIVLSTGILFSVMGFVMANLLHQKISDYLPFMISGLLVWGLISSSISESSQVLVTSVPLITSFPIPIFTHYIRFVLRNYIIFLHNVIILLIVLALFPPQVNFHTWLVIPGLALDMLILMSMAIFLSLANLRYRDTHLAVASTMQVLPFVTPIFWDRGMLEDHKWIADVNPFYHMIQIVRGPMLGQAVSVVSWEVAAALAVTLLITACFLFTRYRHRIIFWL